MQYIQESRLKSKELDYHEMNLFFWDKIGSSHWLERRSSFLRNYDLILNKLDNNFDAAWLRQLRNFIARDNLYHYYSKIDNQWILNNVDVTSVEGFNYSLVRSRPVVFITFHHFFQVLTPMVLAQFFGPVFPFVLDESTESNDVVRNYLSVMYEAGRASLSGGDVLKVGADKTADSRAQTIKVLKQKGSLYAAIDMLHPSLGVNTKTNLTTRHFEFDILAGVVSLGVKHNSQFVFPFMSLERDGTLRLEMYKLEGATTGDILKSFENIFDSIISRDISVWEGASLLSYKEGRFT